LGRRISYHEHQSLTRASIGAKRQLTHATAASRQITPASGPEDATGMASRGSTLFEASRG